MPSLATQPLHNDYANLGPAFATPLPPNQRTTFSQPTLIQTNTALAKALGLALHETDINTQTGFFSGQALPDGLTPVAMAYAGHQFGHLVPQLGDGRAMLLGNLKPSPETSMDIQLKGSGKTPFSRGGDGLSPLGPVLREYLVSEAMHALGIPTTRSLAMVTTGDSVFRDRLLPGAILTRVAKSHIRIGTFVYFAIREETEHLKTLADFLISTHYPDLWNQPNPYLALLDSISSAQLKLVAQWMGVGFIHGVMNTDNSSLTAETIDYGPCAFMDTYKANQHYSYIDDYGRYAYNNQPQIIKWNLAKFAGTLLPLIDPNEDKAIALATNTLQHLDTQFETEWIQIMAKKMTLDPKATSIKKDINDYLASLEQQGLDFTTHFHALNPQQNPKYIPRNHLVEAAISDAVDEGNYSTFFALLERVTKPFSLDKTADHFSVGPGKDELVVNTFCGT